MVVGLLCEEYKFGDIVIIDQFIDFIKKRDYIFYNGLCVVYVFMVDLFCFEMRKIFYEMVKEFGFFVYEKGIYVCIEGLCFFIRVESFMFCQFVYIIGMIFVLEVNFVCEFGMCYVNIVIVIDYDVWVDKLVDVQEVFKVMVENNYKVQEFFKKGILKILEERYCGCVDVLKMMFV